MSHTQLSQELHISELEDCGHSGGKLNCRSITHSLLKTARAILTLLADTDAALAAAAYVDVVDLVSGESGHQEVCEVLSQQPTLHCVLPCSA